MISRRKLLQGSGAGAAAALSSAVGATSAESAAAKKIHWHNTYDVVVCGSGAAGSAAALFAAKSGASVTVLEKSSAWGGTTGKSGFHIWIPNNFELRKQGINDDKRSCLEYIAQYSYPHLFNRDHPTLGIPANNFALLEAFYEQAAPTIEQIMQWDVCQFGTARLDKQGTLGPDYFEHSPYNKVPIGRGLEPRGPGSSHWVGTDVVLAFREALRKLNVAIKMRHRVTDVHRNSQGQVIGIKAEDNQGQSINIRARRGVVFGTGCFSHNKNLMDQFQLLPVSGGCAVPTNEGDFIPIASELGAQLGNMSGAWRAQVILEQSIAYKSVLSAVFWPTGDSMMIVNKYGQRCINEKRNYNDRAKALYHYDANRCEFPNMINMMIYDQRCADLNSYNFPIPPRSDIEDFVVKGDNLAQLSQAIADRLEKVKAHTGGMTLDKNFRESLINSVQRFNTMAKAGVDKDFGRGSYEYDKEWYKIFDKRDDPRWPDKPYSDNTTMYPLQPEGPYYAIILGPGTLGTNGGPVTNPQGEVINYQNQAIEGLYAAGNCMAHPAANAYWAAGATIGTALTFGRIAGESAANAVIKTDS